MGKLSQLLGIGILGFIIISCGNYSKSKNNLESQSALDSGSGSEADSGSGAGSGNEAASLVDFKAINASFLEVRCVGCHGAYKVYANVIRDLNKIQASIETNRMPKFGGALSTDQKLLLAEWIANGAPEIINSSVSNPTQPQPNNPAPPTTPDNPNNPTPPVAPDDPVTPTNPIPPTEPEVIVTFEAIKSKIFEAKCTFCHGGSGFPRFLNCFNP
jgi:hypothetical protein